MRAKDLHDWREKVLARDGYHCHRCGGKSFVIAHHKKSQYVYPELKLRVDNGIALCRKCHSQLKEFALRLIPDEELRESRRKIDLDQLAKEIRAIDRRQVLYQVLRDELSKLGYWKQKPRGNPSKGYQVQRERGAGIRLG